VVNRLNQFTIASVAKKLNQININVSLSHQNPFPNLHLLSHYRFKKRFVKIFPNGDIKGGMCRMIASLIDFSFIRSLVADCYTTIAPPCYDPPSLFLLELFRFIDGYKEMNRFCQLLRDEDRGRPYRQLAGITPDNIPCEATFSHFRKRLGASRYNEIFHVLVDIFHQLQMITFNILAHDGTLYPSWARYKGLPGEMQLRCFPSAISLGKPISAISVPVLPLTMSLKRLKTAFFIGSTIWPNKTWAPKSAFIPNAPVTDSPMMSKSPR
jgi:hypothetical protein